MTDAPERSARVLSTSPFTYERLPILGIVAIAVLLVLRAGLDLESLAFLAATVVVAYVAMRAIGGAFADKVSDGGDHLIVRIGRDEERIFFSNIASVEESGRRPPNIHLTLTYESKFGREIVFIPAGLFQLSWGKSAVFQELDERVRAARQGGAFGKK